ncbi:MAG: hypothetical protein WCJ09_03665 [Planctomycetota bacterium]
MNTKKITEPDASDARPDPLATNMNSNNQEAPTANTEIDSVREPHRLDLELVLANFADEFAAAPVRAADRLHNLLIDPVTSHARYSLLVDLSEKASTEPAGFLSHIGEYVRELVWIANNQLEEAIQSGKASTVFLSQIASRHTLLPRASRAAVEGMEAISDLIIVHQTQAWNWLRDEVLNGNLQEHFGDQILGKYVAIWKKEQPYAEIVIGDSLDEVRAVASERWMVPNALLATTFVDEN